MRGQTVAEMLKKGKAGPDRPKSEPRGKGGRPPARPRVMPEERPEERPEVRRSGRVVKSTKKEIDEQNQKGRFSRLGKRTNWSVKEKQLLLQALNERMSNGQFDYTTIKREIKAKNREDVENYIKTLRKKSMAKKIQVVRKKSPIEIWSNLMKDFGDTDKTVAKGLGKAMSIGATDSVTKYKNLTTDDFRPATVYRYLGTLLRDKGTPTPNLKPLESQVIVDCFQHMLEILKQCGITEQTSFLQKQYFKLCEAAYTGHGDLDLDHTTDAGLPNQTENCDIPGNSDQEEPRANNNEDCDVDAQPGTSGVQSSMSNGLPEMRDMEASDGQLGASGHSWSDILQFLPGEGKLEGLNPGPSYRGGPSSLEARFLNPLGIPDKLLNLFATFGNQKEEETTEDDDSDAESNCKNDEGGKENGDDDDDDGGGDGDDIERDNVDDCADGGQGDSDMNHPEDNDDGQDDGPADDGQNDVGDDNHDHVTNSSETMDDDYEYIHRDDLELTEYDDSNAQGNEEMSVPQGCESEISSSPVKLSVQPADQSEDESQSTWEYGGTSPSPHKNMVQQKSPGKQQITPRKQMPRPHFVLDPLANSRRHNTRKTSRNVTIDDPTLGTSFQHLDHPDDEADKNVSFMLEQKKDHMEVSQQLIDLDRLKANEVPVIRKTSSDPESSSGQLLTLDLSHLKPGANIVIPASALPGGILTIKTPDVQDFTSKEGASTEPSGPVISNLDRMTTDPVPASNVGDPRAEETMSIERESSEPSEAAALWDSPVEKAKSNLDHLNISLPESFDYVSESPDRSMVTSGPARQDSPAARRLKAALTPKKTSKQTQEINYEEFLLGEGIGEKKKSSSSLIRLKIQHRSQGKEKTFLQREIVCHDRSPSGVKEVSRGLPDVSDTLLSPHKTDIKNYTSAMGEQNVIGVTKKGRGRPQKKTPVETSHKSQFVSVKKDGSAVKSPTSEQIPIAKRGPGRPKKCRIGMSTEETAHDLKEQKQSVAGISPGPGSDPGKRKRGRPRKVAGESNPEILEKGMETTDSELDKENDLRERERYFSVLASHSASGLNKEKRKRGRPRKVADEPTSKISDKLKTVLEDEITREQWEGLNSQHASEVPKQECLAEDRNKILHSTPARAVVHAKKVDEDSPKSQQSDTRGNKESKKTGKVQKTLPEIIQELVRNGQKSCQKMNDNSMQSDHLTGRPSKIAARSDPASLSETDYADDTRKENSLQETKNNVGQRDNTGIPDKRKRGRPPKIAEDSDTTTLLQTDGESDQISDGDIKQTRKRGRPPKVLTEEMKADSEKEGSPQKDGPTDLSLSPGPLDLSMKSRIRSELDVRRSPRKRALQADTEQEHLSKYTREQEHTSVLSYGSDCTAIDPIAKVNERSTSEQSVISPASLVQNPSESCPEIAEFPPINDFQIIEDTSSSMSNNEIPEEVPSPSFDSSPSIKQQEIIKVPVSDVQLIRDAFSGIGDVKIIEDISVLKAKPMKVSPRKRVSFANVDLPEGATYQFLRDEDQDLHRSLKKSVDIPLSRTHEGFGEFPDMSPLTRKIRGRGRPKKIQRGNSGKKLREGRDRSGISISGLVPVCPNTEILRYTRKQPRFPSASRLLRATVAEAVEVTIPKAEIYGVGSPLRKKAISSKDIKPKTKSVFFSLKKE